MKKENSQIRLNRIMKERGLRQVDIMNLSKPWQEKLGIKMSKNYLSQYVNGKSNPDQNKLVLLSKTLGVSEPWLMGYEVPRTDSTTEASIDENPLFDETVGKLKQLNRPRQEKILQFVEEQLEEQNVEEKKQSNVVPINKKKLTDEELWDVIEHGVASDGSEQSDAEKQFFFNLLRENLDNEYGDED